MNQEITLEVFVEGNVIFQSDRHWLHPLFDLIDHVEKEKVDLSQAEVHDRIIGLAAALLMLRLGVARVHGGVISELAIEVFRRASVPYSFDTSVKRIECSTESSLLGITDLEEAYRILCKQTKRC